MFLGAFDSPPGQKSRHLTAPAFFGVPEVRFIGKFLLVLCGVSYVKSRYSSLAKNSAQHCFCRLTVARSPSNPLSSALKEKCYTGKSLYSIFGGGQGI